jgi:isochorismate hydrolase
VRASSVDAYSYGFHVVLVEECCFDRSILSHKVNLFDLHHKYADVLHLDAVLAHLEDLVTRGVVATEGTPAIGGVYRLADVPLPA